MQLSARKAVREDFAAFYEACFYADRDNRPLRRWVAWEWEVLVKSGAALSLVVEEQPEREGAEKQLVACAQMAFVTDRFAAWARTASGEGGYNRQAICALPDGSWPLLSPQQIGRANAGDGLTGLFTRWHRADARLPQRELQTVGRFLHDAFQTQTRGYQFKEFFLEAQAKDACDQALRAGFVERSRRPPLFLLGLTREEAFASEGCLMNHYFVHYRPRFGFAPPEQAMLALCRLCNAPDPVLAERLGVSLDKVKNRWRSVYRRIAAVDPDLLPPAEDRVRGPEKRRTLLRYLDSHPEELRPYAPAAEGGGL